MNPDVKPGDTIRAVRMEGFPCGDRNGGTFHADVQRRYVGKVGILIDGPDRDGDIWVEFQDAWNGSHRCYVSEWELVEPTPQPDPLTHLTDHVGSPATLTVAGRTYTATLAHAAAPVGAMEWPSVELTDIKGQA